MFTSSSCPEQMDSNSESRESSDSGRWIWTPVEPSEPETLEEPVAGRGPLGDPSLDFSQFPRLDFSQFPHLDLSKISKLISYLLDDSDTSA